MFTPVGYHNNIFLLPLSQIQEHHYILIDTKISEKKGKKPVSNWLKYFFSYVHLLRKKYFQTNQTCIKLSFMRMYYTIEMVSCCTLESSSSLNSWSKAERSEIINTPVLLLCSCYMNVLQLKPQTELKKNF